LAAKRRPLWALMIAICIPCCGESAESGRGGELGQKKTPGTQKYTSRGSLSLVIWS
jgi:hypothetical protein